MFVDESRGGEGGAPALEIKSLVDDMSRAEEGWSFLVDGRNKFAEDGEEWMIRRIFKEEGLRKIFVHRSQEQNRAAGKIEWNQRGIEGYFRQVRQFKEELFVLVHLSAGAPARGTELITVMHRNPQQGRGQRGVFIDDGMVVFATSYHKNYQHSKTKKPIQRYLPEEVGELLVYYLWLVEPFMRIIQLMAREQVEASDFIWEPKNEEGWGKEDGSESEGVGEDTEGSENEGGRTEEADTSEEERESDSESESGRESESESEDDGRTVVGAAEKARVGRKEKISEDKGDMEVKARNTDGFWGSDRVRNTLRRETGKRIEVRIGTSTWRQAYAAI